MSNLALWYSRIDVDDLMAEIRRQVDEGHEGEREAGGGERRQGAHEGQHEGLRQADRRSSTASPGSRATRR